MALIKCIECGKEISDKASTCPNCGCPVSVAENKENRSSEREESNVKSLTKKANGFPRRIVAIFSVIVLLVFVIASIPTGVEKDKAILKDCLLDPASLQIYTAYTNDNYGDAGRATLFYFGAKNKSGGISDDWAFVYNGSVLFGSNFDAAKNKGDNKGILENGQLAFAKFAIKMGDEDWKEVDIK